MILASHWTGKDGTDANEKDWDTETTRLKEMEWFARHPQYKGIQHLCGIDRLMDTMISLLAEKMITEIPILVRDMKQRKMEVGKWRINGIQRPGGGHPYESDGEARRLA